MELQFGPSEVLNNVERIFDFGRLQPAMMQKPVDWHFSIHPLTNFHPYLKTELCNPAFRLRFKVDLPVEHLYKQSEKQCAIVSLMVFDRPSHRFALRQWNFADAHESLPRRLLELVRCSRHPMSL